jgi:hypothetical protein
VIVLQGPAALQIFEKTSQQQSFFKIRGFKLLASLLVRNL